MASFFLEADTLECMHKGTVIFSDEAQNQQEEKNFHPTRREQIRLSREEYRQIIKEAYQEGQKEARGERKATIQKPVQNSSVMPTTKNERKQIEKQGQQQAIQQHAKEEEENLQRFKIITERHEIEILRTKTVFPFTFFPDTLVIDTTKLTFARKQLFATEYVVTIPLKDLSDVTIQTVLFLGSLIIKYMPQSSSPGMNQPVEIRVANLKREDAIKAKNILKGVLVSKAEEIDIAKLPPEEVVKVLEKFGKSEGMF